MHEPNVGAGQDLEAAAKGNAMRRRDDRRRNFAPAPGHMLGAIGNAMRALGQRAGTAGDALGPIAAEITAEAGQVEPGAEGAPLPRDNHDAQALGLFQLGDRLIDAVKHGGVEGVHLVGANEADIGNAIVQHGD